MVSATSSPLSMPATRPQDPDSPTAAPQSASAAAAATRAKASALAAAAEAQSQAEQVPRPEGPPPLSRTCLRVWGRGRAKGRFGVLGLGPALFVKNEIFSFLFS